MLLTITGPQIRTEGETFLTVAVVGTHSVVTMLLTVSHASPTLVHICEGKLETDSYTGLGILKICLNFEILNLKI